jgi:endonuclease YncB( thermonuclease family)
LLLFLLPAGSAGAVECEAEAAGIAAKGGEAIDGNTLRLDGGAMLRLSGIAAPWRGEGAEKARAAIQELAGGKALKVLPAAGGSDRHARLPAQIFAQSGDSWRWVQGELVAMGLARVEPFADNRGCAALLLEMEARARSGQRGLWRDPANAVRGAGDVAALTGMVDSFQIIEGKVLSVGSSGHHIYLNFGRHWKNDFTAQLAAGKADEFRAAGHDLLGLAGKKVRVRGWLEERGGPMIELEHPMQIELAGEDE